VQLEIKALDSIASELTGGNFWQSSVITYKKKEYNFIYYTKNLAERKFLTPGSLTNNKFPIY
jgi:hypothetical protein